MPDTLSSTKTQGRKARGWAEERIWVFKWHGKWHVWCDGCASFASCRSGEGCRENHKWPSHTIAMLLANEHLKVWHS